MPDMHGIDVLRFVRQQPAAARVVALTTPGDDSIDLAAQQAGSDPAYLTKPFIPGTWRTCRGLLVEMTRWSRGDHRFRARRFP